MKARMKHTVSWILTLALVFGCLAGTGMTAKAADATKIQVTVVDAEGNPVEGVKFALQLSGDIVATISSGQDGKLEYDVSSYGLEDLQILKLVLAADASHVSETTGINYKVENGVITQYRIGSSGNYQNYTGNDQLKFVVAEKASGTVDKSTLTVRVVDENTEELITDSSFKLGLIDKQFPKVENSKTLNNGAFL